MDRPAMLLVLAACGGGADAHHASCDAPAPACLPSDLRFAGSAHVVVDICATWAIPCEREADQLVLLASDPSVRVVQILIDADAHQLDEWRRAHAGALLVFGGADPLARAFHDDEVPTTYAYDPRGKQLGRHVGIATADDLRALLSP